MDSPSLLIDFETCDRKGAWSMDWKKWKIDNTDFLQRSIRAGLMSPRRDFGDAAGEESMSLGAEPGLDSREHNLFDQVVHLAAISDLICQATRKPSELPWLLPNPIEIGEGVIWNSGAYLAPDRSHLRRMCLVSGWSDDRHFSEARSWRSIGEVAAYDLPMKQIVAVVGPNRAGKRHGHWSRAVMHPVNHKVRFRKRSTATPFKESWISIWREDHDEVSSETWLQGMLDDGVLTDVLFIVDIPPIEKSARQQILDLACRKLDRLYNMKTLPDKNLSTCDFPLPCQFRTPCHAQTTPSGKFGFVRVEDLI